MFIRLLFYLQFILGVNFTYSQTLDESKPDWDKTKTFLMHHNYLQAIDLCNKKINLSIVNNNTLDHSLFLGLKGVAYLDTINADSGKFFLEKALAEAYSLKYDKSIFNSLQGLGKYHYRNCSYKTSIKYFQLLNYYSVTNSDVGFQLISNYYLSANYNLLKNYPLSVVYARKASYTALQTKDTISYIKSILAIGTQYFALGNSDSSEFYCALANNFYDKYSVKNPGLGADINNSFLKTQIQKKDYDKGIYYGRLAVADCIKDNNAPSLNIFYDNLAICFSSKKMYDSAVFYYEKALEIETTYNYVDEYKEDLKELVKIYKAVNDPGKAMFYMQKYIDADSLYKQTNVDVVDSLKNAFEQEKNKLTLRSEENKLKELYTQKQKYYLLIGVLSLLFSFLFFYLFYTRYKIRKEKEKQNLLIKIQETEIKALQAQINPHFIFNSLNSILEYIRKSEKEEAILYLTKFSKLMRMVLEASNKRSTLLMDEIELLSLYMDLENFRFGNNFKCETEIEKGLDVHNIEIPFMIIQPFLENAILHGLQNKFSLMRESDQNFSGKVHLSFKQKDKYILCTIEDNGIGRAKAEEIKKNKLFSHKSMGMRITQDRLDLLGQNKCKIEFIDLKDEKSNPAGTKVEILIPIIEEF